MHLLAFNKLLVGVIYHQWEPTRFVTARSGIRWHASALSGRLMPPNALAGRPKPFGSPFWSIPPTKSFLNAQKCLQMPQDAIKCLQMPSNAIKCHQMPSNAIKCRQMPSNAFKCRQMPSRAIKCRRGPLNAVAGRRGPRKISNVTP